MAKQGFTINNVPELVGESGTWALCVGSGISYPVFPMWKDLAHKVVQRYYPAADAVFEDLYKNLSPDILLQSVLDITKHNPAKFSEELTQVLYEDFFRGLTQDELFIVRKCLTSNPGDNHVQWDSYLDIVNEVVRKANKPSLTAMSLAESVLALRQRERAPSAVLSFNAEMLFGSLMNAIAHVKYGEQHKFLDFIIEPTSFHDRYRIPYYFCHGTMPVPGTKNRGANSFNAPDRMVFLENEYLQLANSAYSWQSSAFISTVSSHTVIFVGLSLVDPNIRRWLAWVQKDKQVAIQKKIKRITDSTSHYWIETKPKTLTEMRMMESSVSHLGIRIIWLDSWGQTQGLLEKLISVGV